jgi:hypothetical protein
MPKPDPVKERYWRRLLRQWQRSGLTGRDFCAERGLSEPSFYAWRREIARRDQALRPAAKTASPSASHAGARGTALPAFLPITVEPVPVLPALEVVLAGSRVLRIPAGVQAATLHHLLRLLEEPAC